MSMPRDLVEIDPKGDLILDVSSERTERLRVSSKALCLASPVFRAMLESPLFREGRALETATTKCPFEMQLRDDNYESLLFMIYAIHLKTRKIPYTISLDGFYQLAVVCDKYDVAEIFVPWVKMWTENFDSTTREIACQRWLVISWVFRSSEIFAIITKEMIYSTSLSATSERDDGVETGIVPDQVFDSARAVKQKKAASLLSLAAQEFDSYKSSMQQGSNMCIVNVNEIKRDACDNMSIGGLMKYLFVARLWPIASETSSSIQTILDAFVPIDSSHKCLGFPSHNDCSPSKRLNSAANEILTAIEGLKLSDFCHPDTIFFPNEDQGVYLTTVSLYYDYLGNKDDRDAKLPVIGAT